MAKTHRSFKQNKPRMFVIFLFLAVLFWVLTKFSKDTAATIEASLNFDNLPENTALSSDDPQKITFDITANGFEFLNYKLKPPIININLSQYAEGGAAVAIVSQQELTRIINDQLNRSLSVQNLSLKDLVVQLDAIISKKVAVRTKSNISFKDGFKMVGVQKIEPDSVEVSGPEHLLDTLLQIETKQIVGANLDSNYSEVIELKKPEDPLLTIKPAVINFNIEVQEFTQKELTLPIRVINAPKDINMKLIPENVLLTFDVSINDFNAIGTSDFLVECDYNDRNMEENYMVPKLSRSPSNVQHIELSIRRVNYLIFK